MSSHKAAGTARAPEKLVNIAEFDTAYARIRKQSISPLKRVAAAVIDVAVAPRAAIRKLDGDAFDGRFDDPHLTHRSRDRNAVEAFEAHAIMGRVRNFVAVYPPQNLGDVRDLVREGVALARLYGVVTRSFNARTYAPATALIRRQENAPVTPGDRFLGLDIDNIKAVYQAIETVSDHTRNLQAGKIVSVSRG